MKSTKAMPSEIRDLDSDLASTPDQIPSSFAFVLLPIFAAVSIVACELLPKRRSDAPTPRTCPAWYFSPQISFRPPPER